MHTPKYLTMKDAIRADHMQRLDDMHEVEHDIHRYVAEKLAERTGTPWSLFYVEQKARREHFNDNIAAASYEKFAGGNR